MCPGCLRTQISHDRFHVLPVCCLSVVAALCLSGWLLFRKPVSESSMCALALLWQCLFSQHCP
jgi:hypothetical protein